MLAKFRMCNGPKFQYSTLLLKFSKLRDYKVQFRQKRKPLHLHKFEDRKFASLSNPLSVKLKKGRKGTCIYKNFHVHQSSDARIMENENAFQEYDI